MTFGKCTVYMRTTWSYASNSKRKDSVSPKTPTTLGQTLRTARQEAGLSVRQLARAAGISHGYLVKLETDQNDNPSAAHLQRLADVLEIDAGQLLTFIGVKPASRLPAPRVYFRRKLGLSATEADRLSRLVEDYAKPPNQGNRHL
jgi:transcriptional regulator with XRE-family HTH domain